jgi:hypothetical protein
VCSSDIQPELDHLSCHSVVRSGFFDGHPASRYVKRCFFGNEECASQPVSLILFLSIPLSATTVVKRRPRLVLKQSMRELVRDIASLASAVVSIIEDYKPRGSSKHGYSGECLPIDSAEMMHCLWRIHAEIPQ